MNEQRIQELKNSLMELFQAIESSGEEIIGELESMLVQAMEHVANRIQQLRQENPVDGMPPLSPQGPSGPHGPDLTQSMPSSNIEGFSYDKDSGRLLVRFLGKHPDRNGPIYGYEGVPQNIFDIFRKGAIPAKTNGKNKWGEWWKGKYPSIGAAMYHLIRAGGYQYQRLT